MNYEQLIRAIEMLLNSRFNCIINDVAPQKETDNVLHILFEALIDAANNR